MTSRTRFDTASFRAVSAMFWLFSFCVAAGLTTFALMLHLLTFLPLDVDFDIRRLFLLHVVAMFVVAPAALAYGSGKGLLPRELRAELPYLLRILFVSAILYLPVSFFVCLSINHWSTPAVESGQYMLESHGRTTKQLTREQYFYHRRVEFRMASGFWAVFLWLSTVLYYWAWSSRRCQTKVGKT